MIQSFLPTDATPEEVQILNHVMVEFYRKFTDPIDKLVISLCFDLGYSYVDASEMIGISYVSVWKRRKRIEEHLAKVYDGSLHSQVKDSHAEMIG